MHLQIDSLDPPSHPFGVHHRSRVHLLHHAVLMSRLCRIRSLTRSQACLHNNNLVQSIHNKDSANNLFLHKNKMILSIGSHLLYMHRLE